MRSVLEKKAAGVILVVKQVGALHKEGGELLHFFGHLTTRVRVIEQMQKFYILF